MMKSFLKRHLIQNRDLIIREGRQINGFMRLLMKRRNNGDGWTGEEQAQLKGHLRHLSLYVPALIIFLLPFGSFLLPVLALVLDGRRTQRTS